MQVKIGRIKNTLHCTEAQAIAVKAYIDKGAMISWTNASDSLINAITRAVHDKLLRDAPAKKTAEVKVTVTATPKAKTPKAKASKAPAKGTKIAHAMAIYKEMQVDGVQCSRKDTISAIANSMQITPQQAAGYYQNCKKKVA